MKRIAVYCGSNKGVRPIYAGAAEEHGKQLAREKIDLVYGGGMIGLMGVVADAVLNPGKKGIAHARRTRSRRRRGLGEWCDWLFGADP